MGISVPAGGSTYIRMPGSIRAARRASVSPHSSARSSPYEKGARRVSANMDGTVGDSAVSIDRGDRLLIAVSSEPPGSSGVWAKPDGP